MTFLQKLLKVLRAEEPTPTIKRTEVTDEFVDKAINSYTDKHADDADTIGLDATYYTTSTKGMQTIIEHNDVEDRKYTESTYDCENFALSFMASSQREFGVTTIGTVIDWSGGHAYNILVYEDGKVKLFEPQSDEFREPGETDLFAFERVEIII